ASMLGRENHRAFYCLEMLTAFDADPRKDPRDRQNPGRQADAAHRASGPRAVPHWKVDRFGRRGSARVASVDERPQLSEVARGREGAFVDASLKFVFECDH